MTTNNDTCIPKLTDNQQLTAGYLSYDGRPGGFAQINFVSLQSFGCDRQSLYDSVVCTNQMGMSALLKQNIC